MDHPRQIKLLLVALATYLQTTLTDEQIIMYAKELENDGVGFVIAACNVFKHKTYPLYGKFPTPAQMREAVNGDEDDYALESSLKIITSVSKFGAYNGKEAKEFIGQLGWDVVQSYGGWASVCARMDTDKVPIFQSQFQKTAKMLIGMSRRPSRDGASLASPELRKQISGKTEFNSIGTIIGRLQQQDTAPQGGTGEGSEDA